MLVALYIINSACWWHWHRRNVKRWRHIDDINDIIATAWHWLFHFLGGQANNYFHTKKQNVLESRSCIPAFLVCFCLQTLFFFLIFIKTSFGPVLLLLDHNSFITWTSTPLRILWLVRWNGKTTIYEESQNVHIALEYRYTPKCVHMWTIWHIVCVPKATFWCVRTLSSQLKMRSYTYWNWF